MIDGIKHLVSTEVFENTNSVLLGLGDLKINDYYVTDYKTIILEITFEYDLSNEFTIEVGKNSFGYFSILYGMICDYIEEVDVTTETIEELKTVIQGWYKKIKEL